jgi:CRP/FNR family cyclic AMP-dependent transcriptional regulator
MADSIFDGISAEDVARIKAAGRPVKVPAGWSPISEKTGADKAYVLLEGEASVRRGGREIAVLGPGEVVGEAAIINRTLRTASVVALTPLSLIHFTSETLRELAEEVPAFGANLRAATDARLGTAGDGS